ncbi:MAG: MBL fold metallo-hydrolase [Planctomycetota bacterium]
MAELQFYGAVRSVTGSMHVLRRGDSEVLLECGLYQGKRADALKRNRHLPFDPARLTACTLSHAHIDHSGNLPNLVKNGYRGSVYATAATCDLGRALLKDSAHIQRMDAEYYNRKHKDKPPIEPIYSEHDAREALTRFETVRYHERFEVAPGIHATFYDAGHILGSAAAVYELEEHGRTIRVGFTGDLGRPNHPILRDPQYLPPMDYLITESTYGNRVHEAVTSMKGRLKDVVQRTVDQGGRVVIPAFSVGRTQNLVYYLAELFHEGELDPLPVYVDSPLAIDASKAYRGHPECYDQETRDLLEDGGKPFGFDLLTYTRSVEQSKEINASKHPCVIISASGMCEGGRILHHLKHSVADPKNTILIVGYQAVNTLGRRIVDEAPKLRIYGKSYPLRAQVERMNGFSAHADRDEMASYVKQIPGLKKVFVVHGEEQSSLAFQAYLEKLGLSAYVPQPLEKVEL